MIRYWFPNNLVNMIAKWVLLHTAFETSVIVKYFSKNFIIAMKFGCELSHQLYYLVL